jgi:hypothetical protein
MGVEVQLPENTNQYLRSIPLKTAPPADRSIYLSETFPLNNVLEE